MAGERSHHSAGMEMARLQRKRRTWRAHAVSQLRQRTHLPETAVGKMDADSVLHAGSEFGNSLAKRYQGVRYLANLPIMVLAFKNNQDAAVTIPADEVFDAVGLAPDDRFVVVNVHGQEFLVFECDLIERGTPVRQLRP